MTTVNEFCAHMFINKTDVNSMHLLLISLGSISPQIQQYESETSAMACKFTPKELTAQLPNILVWLTLAVPLQKTMFDRKYCIKSFCHLKTLENAWKI